MISPFALADKIHLYQIDPPNQIIVGEFADIISDLLNIMANAMSGMFQQYPKEKD